MRFQHFKKFYWFLLKDDLADDMELSLNGFDIILKIEHFFFSNLSR